MAFKSVTTKKKTNGVATFEVGGVNRSWLPLGPARPLCSVQRCPAALTGVGWAQTTHIYIYRCMYIYLRGYTPLPPTPGLGAASREQRFSAYFHSDQRDARAHRAGRPCTPCCSTTHQRDARAHRGAARARKRKKHRLGHAQHRTLLSETRRKSPGKRPAGGQRTCCWAAKSVGRRLGAAYCLTLLSETGRKSPGKRPAGGQRTCCWAAKGCLTLLSDRNQKKISRKEPKENLQESAWQVAKGHAAGPPRAPGDV